MKKRIPGIRLASNARLHLYKELNQLFQFMVTELQKIVDENKNPSLQSVEVAFTTVKERMKQQYPDDKLSAIFERAAQFIESRTQKDFQRQLERIKVQPIIIAKPHALQEAFVKEHVQLITSATQEQLSQVEQICLRGIRQGSQTIQIAKEIRATTSLDSRRALLIARNATLQYSGSLTKHNQTSVGIKQYRWSCSGDERVRKSHHDRHNNIYSWDGPGPHPRQEVNCRCDAIPVFYP